MFKFILFKKILQELDNTLCICVNCYTLIDKIQKFSKRCQKAQLLLNFLSTSMPLDDLNSVRRQFGLSLDSKTDMSTDATIDIEIVNIKNEFTITQNQGLIS